METVEKISAGPGKGVSNEDLPYGCVTCGDRWSGYGTAHCGNSAGSCHRTFTGVSAFDAHRKGVSGSCVHPTAAGLTINPGRRGSSGVWGVVDTKVVSPSASSTPSLCSDKPVLVWQESLF